jgi:hypothetical protein
MLAAPALGDVFACDQDDHVIARPLHGLGIFADPNHLAVLADFSDLPVMRTAEFFGADRQLIFDGLPVLFKKHRHYRVPDQLIGSIAELIGTKVVHRQQCPGCVDHEIHQRIMFENFPPLLLALSQRFLDTLLFGNVAAGCHDHRPTPDRLEHRVRRLPDVRQGDEGGGAIKFLTKPFGDQDLRDESVRSAPAKYRRQGSAFSTAPTTRAW